MSENPLFSGFYGLSPGRISLFSATRTLAADRRRRSSDQNLKNSGSRPDPRQPAPTVHFLGRLPGSAPVGTVPTRRQGCADRPTRPAGRDRPDPRIRIGTVVSGGIGFPPGLAAWQSQSLPFPVLEGLIWIEPNPVLFLLPKRRYLPPDIATRPYSPTGSD